MDKGGKTCANCELGDTLGLDSQALNRSWSKNILTKASRVWGPRERSEGKEYSRIERKRKDQEEDFGDTTDRIPGPSMPTAVCSF